MDRTQLQELLKRHEEEWNKLSPEEKQMKLQGYTDAQYEDYKKNSFSTDYKTVLDYIKANECYDAEAISYQNKPEINFIHSKLFFIIFREESICIDNYDYTSRSVLNDLICINYSGMGSNTVMKMYEPDENDLKYTKTVHERTVSVGTGSDTVQVRSEIDPDVIQITVATHSITHLRSEMLKLRKVLNAYFADVPEDDNDSTTFDE